MKSVRQVRHVYKLLFSYRCSQGTQTTNAHTKVWGAPGGFLDKSPMIYTIIMAKVATQYLFLAVCHYTM